ncbi:nucleotidyltransferase domain-containing protein [Hansschlegelia plantiphila]|uniref:Nucleotidyltransferase-like domain-containing protein n=1 Tax=Hansschlegelia plantiphila TaxID=374655 RepID=A0A9W6IZU6_9HYPH|nr:nucleotidyltransferase domain-containing protein [Hansschlegelia plantiphila]GLK66704.1 hypothetical protein GCM10008179_03420 [Hansschlegelia plantiphila]
MSFAVRRNRETLLRDYYDPVSGVKRQKSLGPRSSETEATAERFAAGKEQAAARLSDAKDALRRQAGVNRVLRLGRVPDIAARVVRELEDAGLLGRGVRVLGTNALFAYEAAAGVHFASDVMTTEDIDILFHARAKLRFAAEEGVQDRTLMSLLRKADATFEKTGAAFQAWNASGYLVDLIRPVRTPPWREDRSSISADPSDLNAVEIEGLLWHESAPPFESVAIDAKGFPVRLVVPDPRAFAVHKLWLSRKIDRNPLKRRRDEAQARAVAALTGRYLTHLPFEDAPLKSFPKTLVEAAAPLFA